MEDDKLIAPEVKVIFIDNAYAQEVFASDAASFWLNQGNVHITLISNRTNITDGLTTLNQVVTARIIMPIIGAQSLAAGLYDYLKKQGLDPVPVPDKSQIQ